MSKNLNKWTMILMLQTALGNDLIAASFLPDNQTDTRRSSNLSIPPLLTHHSFASTTVSSPSQLIREQAIEMLSQNMPVFYKDHITNELDKVTPDHYQTFTDTCKNLFCQNMSAEDKLAIIGTVIQLEQSKWTQEFTDTCKKLFSKDMSIHEKILSIHEMSKIDPAHYQMCIATCKKLFSHNILWRVALIRAVTKLEPAHYQAFAYTCESLFSKKKSPDAIISVVELVKPAHYKEFANIAKQIFSQNIGYEGGLIRKVAKLEPIDYQPFIDTCMQLLSPVDTVYHACSIRPQHKALSDGGTIINLLATLHSSTWTKEFTDTCNTIYSFLPSMHENKKCSIISAVAKLQPSHYQIFTQICQQFASLRSHPDSFYILVDLLVNAQPSNWTIEFIDFCNTIYDSLALMSGTQVNSLKSRLADLDPIACQAFSKLCNALFTQNISRFQMPQVVDAAVRITPNNYPLLQTYLRRHPNYFRYVSFSDFDSRIKLNMNAYALTTTLNQLYTDYYFQAPPTCTGDLEHEIHNFTHQQVVNASGDKARLIDAAYAEITNINVRNSKPILNFDEATKTLKVFIGTLLGNSTLSAYVTTENLDWAIGFIKEGTYVDMFSHVVTLLQDSPESLESWITVFLTESKTAHQGQNSGRRTNYESCVQGVRERIITSLRGSVEERYPTLQDILVQPELILTFKAKVRSLGDADFWGNRLKAVNIMSTSSETQAKEAYTKSFDEYFAEFVNSYEFQQDISQMREEMLNDSTFPDMWTRIKVCLEEKVSPSSY